MGKRKRAEFQYHDPLSKAVVNKIRLTEVDPIIEGWKFLSLMNRKSDVFSRCPILKNNTNVDDHISLLPDDVLQFIISLLTMRRGASTSILSTRWRNLWRSSSVSCLNFDSVNMIGNYYPKNKLKQCTFLANVRSKFVKWVDAILQLRQGAKIDSLRVCFHLDKESTSSIDRWMELVSAQGVRELVLDLSLLRYGFGHEYKKLYQFPHEVFSHGNGSSLIYLHLEACIFRLPQEFKSFNSLLSLTLGCTWMTRQDVIHIVSNCSFLEWLSIRNCNFPRSTNLKFAGPSLHLKHLSVLACTNLVGIEVEAASLVSFEYVGRVVRLSFKNVSKVVRVYIGFPIGVNLDGVTYALNKLPNNFPLLETLFLWRYHSLFRKENILPATLPTFTNLKRLVLCCQTNNTKNLLELTSLLDACPLLQKLELDLCVHYESEYLQTEKLAEVTRKQGSSHNNIKEIDIYGFRGHHNEIELTKCLLKIATALQKMEIYTDIPWFYSGNGQWTFLRRIERPAGIPIKKAYKLLRKELRSTTKLIIWSP